MPKRNKTTIILSVQNEPGVLYKIAGLLRKRRFNIESITASPTHDPKITRITLLVDVDQNTVQKMINQLFRIVEVIEAKDPFEKSIVARELALVKVKAHQDGAKTEISTIAKHFRAKIININPKYMMLEITGNEDKIDAFYENMQKFGILEFVRTGRTALFK